MTFVHAKCTACGANMQIDKSLEAANCEYCGAAFIVKKAINNYNIANTQINGQTVNVNVGTNSSKLKENAEKSFAAGQFKNAYLDFRKAVEMDRTDSEAYWGIVRVHMVVYPNLYVGSEEQGDIVYYLMNNPTEYDYRNYGQQAIESYFTYWKINEREIPDYVYITNAYKCAISYAPDGVAEKYQKIIDEHNRKYFEIKKIKEANELQRAEQARKSGCYIATAVYGDYNAPQVMTLRRYRDNTLSKMAVGRLFIKTYYKLSPPIAKRLKNMRRLNAFVRGILDKIVAHITS